jgi:hypothetical protein
VGVKGKVLSSIYSFLYYFQLKIEKAQWGLASFGAGDVTQG